MKSLFNFALLLATLPTLYGQDFAEFRAGTNRYRYADWMRTFKSGFVADIYYIGTPGANEANAGVGYTFKLGPITLTPLAYATLTKENAQPGMKAALLGSLDWRGWKAAAYLARGVNLADHAKSYLVLDTLDITHTVGKHWEAGASFGVFRAGGAWNAQLGPMVKRNDRLGAWCVSMRGGPQKELRFGRIIAR